MEIILEIRDRTFIIKADRNEGLHNMKSKPNDQCHIDHTDYNNFSYVKYYHIENTVSK